ncbi:PREDICTED: linoleate 13S-lipoxygenase 2-1, chloroplastic-like [Nelumbo nucifera]|uniref:Linoleate 13S-lipoxygenase 2-1, chloroplastic-like n=1 Tax=Nelumbo nucifera TaxID=4432 RepID=A0A1U8Q3F9_NELNU|nr:PREDICTED: linoleate 13S-lipoxygenase 2-1, chloroplastic-like [Nelumbo nucifera]
MFTKTLLQHQRQLEPINVSRLILHKSTFCTSQQRDRSRRTSSSLLFFRPPAGSSLHQKRIRCVRSLPGNNIGTITRRSEESAGTSSSSSRSTVSVKAIVTVKLSFAGFFSKLGLTQAVDIITDMMGKTLLLELISLELDPRTGLEKNTMKGYARWVGQEGDEMKYESSFIMEPGFGEIGAVVVENQHHNEMFVKNITLLLINGSPDYTPSYNITCNSWVHSKYDNPEKRIFFTIKCYLPWETPHGLKRLREKELENLRGNEEGDPDKKDELARPVLGGKKFPYPRRCRAGRQRCKTDRSRLLDCST